MLFTNPSLTAIQITSWDQPGHALAVIKFNSRREAVCELVYEAFEDPDFIDALVTAMVLLYGKGGDIGPEMVMNTKEVMNIMNNVATIANIVSVL